MRNSKKSLVGVLTILAIASQSVAFAGDHKTINEVRDGLGVTASVSSVGAIISSQWADKLEGQASIAKADERAARGLPPYVLDFPKIDPKLAGKYAREAELKMHRAGNFRFAAKVGVVLAIATGPVFLLTSPVPEMKYASDRMDKPTRASVLEASKEPSQSPDSGASFR